MKDFCSLLIVKEIVHFVEWYPCEMNHYLNIYLICLFYILDYLYYMIQYNIVKRFVNNNE